MIKSGINSLGCSEDDVRNPQQIILLTSRLGQLYQGLLLLETLLLTGRFQTTW